MDGTLTIPALNFLEMRTRLGLSRGVDILPTVMVMPAEEREQAMEIIREMEEEGLPQHFMSLSRVMHLFYHFRSF